jgi:hypothetical protein
MSLFSKLLIRNAPRERGVLKDRLPSDGFFESAPQPPVRLHAPSQGAPPKKHERHSGAIPQWKITCEQSLDEKPVVEK